MNLELLDASAGRAEAAAREAWTDGYKALRRMQAMLEILMRSRPNPQVTADLFVDLAAEEGIARDALARCADALEMRDEFAHEMEVQVRGLR